MNRRSLEAWTRATLRWRLAAALCWTSWSMSFANTELRNQERLELQAELAQTRYKLN
jgi:hypothetical protein